MTKTTDLVTTKPGALTAGSDAFPAFLQAKVHEDAGKGVSQAADDSIIPLVYILQSNSPQIQRRGPDYIEGAKDGDLWLRNSGVPPIDGDHGLLFQPCYFFKEWVMWAPRKSGEGIKDRATELPPEAVEREVPDDEDPTKTRKKWVMPDGTECIETRYHVGYAYIEALVDGTKDEYVLTGQVMPFVIPFKSTGHTSSRQWTFLMNSKIVGSDVAPSWAALYRVKTKSKTNPSGTWNVITVDDAGWVQSQDEYDRGAKLHTQMALGEKKVDTTDNDPEEQPQGDNATGKM